MRTSAIALQVFLRLCLAVMRLCLAVSPLAASAADNFPNKPIRVVVPMAPGGAIDILMRPLADRIGTILGAPVVIENRGGGGGNIGGEAVARASPDGYTLLVTTSGLVVANKSLYRKLPFDPEADFAPVCIIAALPNVLVVNAESPYKSVRDIIEAAKAKPGQLTFASGGNGSSNHLAGELLKSLAGVDLVHTPYRGGGPAIVAVMSGEVAMLFATLPSAVGPLRSGKLRALAVTTRDRAPSLPDVPTMMEAGVKDFDMSVWIGALAPKGTPQPVIHKFNQAIVQALESPDVQERLTAEGYQRVGDSPAEMADVIRVESAKWSRIIKGAGIKAE